MVLPVAAAPRTQEPSVRVALPRRFPHTTFGTARGRVNPYYDESSRVKPTNRDARYGLTPQSFW